MEFNYIFDVKFLNDKKANADMEINIEIPQGVTEICSKALVNSGFKTISTNL